jgi:hypothetical protein
MGTGPTERTAGSIRGATIDKSSESMRAPPWRAEGGGRRRQTGLGRTGDTIANEAKKVILQLYTFQKPHISRAMSSQQPNLHFSVERWSADNLLQPQKIKTLLDSREVETDTHDLEIAADERSRAKIKEMVDLSIREMIGMSLDDLTIKLGDIKDLRAEIEDLKQRYRTFT